MPPAAPGAPITLPVTEMFPPIELLLIVNAPICVTQVGAAVDVPIMMMLLPVIIEAALLKTPRTVVVPPVKLTLPLVEVMVCE